MVKFVPREKLGRKARKALDSRRRTAWDVRPVTRRIESKKLYDRKKASREFYDDTRDAFPISFC